MNCLNVQKLLLIEINSDLTWFSKRSSIIHNKVIEEVLFNIFKYGVRQNFLKKKYHVGFGHAWYFGVWWYTALTLSGPLQNLASDRWSKCPSSRVQFRVTGAFSGGVACSEEAKKIDVLSGLQKVGEDCPKKRNSEAASEWYIKVNKENAQGCVCVKGRAVDCRWQDEGRMFQAQRPASAKAQVKETLHIAW